jgi:putative oxidoreductase
MATAYTTAPAGPFAAFGRLAGPTHALLRIGAGLLFMQHGAQKLFGELGGMDGQGARVGNLMSQMGLAGILEFFGGLLIAIGLATRPVAAILCLQMIAAYFIAHSPQGGFPVQNGGELALLYALVWAYFAGNGAGPASVDAALARRRGPGRNS